MRFPTALSFFGIAVLLSVSLGPSITRADDSPLLRYNFQAGQQYGYHVDISASIAGIRRSWSGAFAYTCAADAEGKLSLQIENDLVARLGTHATLERYADQRQPGAQPIAVPNVVPATADPAAIHHSRTTQPPQANLFSPAGDLAERRVYRRLPLLLGDQDLLVIQPLAEKAAHSWTRQNDMKLIDLSGETLAAKETIRFKIAAVKGQSIHLVKSYVLRTTDESGYLRINMAGCGSLVFDTGLGQFRSEAMSYEIELKRGGDTLSIPVTVSCQYADTAQVAAETRSIHNSFDRQREIQARLDANRPKPLTAEARAAALTDLHSSEANVVKAAAKRLAQAVREEPADNVSAAIVQAMSHGDDPTKGDLLDALAVWGTAAAEPALIEAAKSTTFFVRDKAIDQLGRKFKDDAAIDAVVAQVHASRGMAPQALRKMGPAVEKAVIPLLKDTDFGVRNEAVNILRDIGGQKSLHALKQQLKTATAANNMRDINNFSMAVRVIQQRIGTAAATAAEKPGEPTLRTWSDLSGTFEIEATLTGVKDHKATLKKKDGSELTVPLEKLSEDDQDYVKDYLKAQAEAKPVNPFQ